MGSNKSAYGIFVIATVTFFVACTGAGHHAIPGSRPSAAPAGTGDGGGGNTCQGRPIESYVLNIEGSPAYKQFIEPLLAPVMERHDNMARLLSYAIKKKNWYLLPCPLKTLPPTKIGAMVETEQAALQTFTEVWMSEELFTKMQPKDQADLVMHEMLMAIKLLSLDSPQAQCKSFAHKISYCDDADKKAVGSPKDLTDHDYENVRRATVKSFSLRPGASSEDWEDFLAMNGFRGLPGWEFMRKEDTSDVSASDFTARLQRGVYSGLMPMHGISFGRIKAKDEKCSVELKEKSGMLDVSVRRENGEVIHQIVKIPESMKLQRVRYGQHRYMSARLEREDIANLKQGERTLSISFGFDSDYDLAIVDVQEMACVERSGSSQTFVSPSDGFNYLCSIHPDID